MLIFSGSNLFGSIHAIGLFVLFFVLFNPYHVLSQKLELDSTSVVSESISYDTTMSEIHDPHKATIFSLIIPGAGQIYNKKYWKIPIIYAGFGVFMYFIKFNDNEYKKYREAYYHSITNDGTEPPVNEYEEKYNSDQLLSAKNDYRRNRDLTYILTGLWYILNVVDATVDAHLFNWNVDENLSIRMEPAIFRSNIAYKPGGGGVKLSIRF